MSDEPAEPARAVEVVPGRGRRGKTQRTREIFEEIVGAVAISCSAGRGRRTTRGRALGTLSHMLMTDLSAAEIVLGKLGSRLMPVLSMLVCALPILELLTLLGGVDPTALQTGFVVAASVALLGSSLAIYLSLWMRKAHEALMMTCASLGAWLLTWPSIELLATQTGWLRIMPSRVIDPFYMALAPYWRPGAVALGDYISISRE